MSKIFLITGATGTGKTRLATEFARQIGAIVIPIDQLHFYKHLEKGTNLDHTFLEGLQTHGYQTLSPWQVFTPKRYVAWLKEALGRFFSKSPIIIEGGCTSYLQQLMLERPHVPLLNEIEIFGIGVTETEEHRRKMLFDFCSASRTQEIVDEVKQLHSLGFYNESGIDLFKECEIQFKHSEHDHSGLAWALRISAGVYFPAYLGSVRSLSLKAVRDRIVENVFRIQNYQDQRIRLFIDQSRVFTSTELIKLLKEKANSIS